MKVALFDEGSQGLPHSETAHGSQSSTLLTHEFSERWESLQNMGNLLQTCSNMGDGSANLYVETWFLDQRFRVGLAPRKVKIDVDSIEGFEGRCREAWQEVVDASPLTLHVVHPKPASSGFVLAHVLIVQQERDEDVAVLIRHEGLPLLNKHRAVLASRECTVADVLQLAHLYRPCLRPRTVCTFRRNTERGHHFLLSEDVIELTRGECVEAQIRVDDSESENEQDESEVASVASVAASPNSGTTTCPNDESDTEVLSSDEESLMSLHAMSGIQMFAGDIPDPPWEANQLAPEMNDLQEEESEIAFAQGHSEDVQAWVDGISSRAENAESHGVAITFGLGLGDLGRRDCRFDLHDQDDLIRQIQIRWTDHLQHSNAELLFVWPQLELQPAPNIVLIVAFQNGEPDVAPHARTLVIEDSAPDSTHNPNPYAAFLTSPSTVKRITAQLGFHQCFPLGVHTCEVVVAGHPCEGTDEHDIPDGALVHTFVGPRPRMVFDLQHLIANVDQFYIHLSSAH